MLWSFSQLTDLLLVYATLNIQSAPGDVHLLLRVVRLKAQNWWKKQLIITFKKLADILPHKLLSKCL